MTDVKPKTLTEAFATTDTLRHGPFVLIKQPGQHYKEALFTVDGYLVPVRPAQKKLMALLISQKGGDMTLPLLAEGMETPRFNAISRELKNPQRKDDVIEELSNTIRVHISMIRKAIRETLDEKGVGEERRNQILDSIQPLRQKGSKDKKTTSFDSGYRIDLLP